MTARREVYVVRHYEWADGKRMPSASLPDFRGTLERACKRLLKVYGRAAPVRVIGPGHYRIADGAAELKAMHPGARG